MTCQSSPCFWNTVVIQMSSDFCSTAFRHRPSIWLYLQKIRTLESQQSSEIVPDLARAMEKRPVPHKTGLGRGRITMIYDPFEQADREVLSWKLSTTSSGHSVTFLLRSFFVLNEAGEPGQGRDPTWIGQKIRIPAQDRCTRS